MTTLTRKIWCEPEYGQSVHIRFTVTGEHGWRAKRKGKKETNQ